MRLHRSRLLQVNMRSVFSIFQALCHLRTFTPLRTEYFVKNKIIDILLTVGICWQLSFTSRLEFQFNFILQSQRLSTLSPTVFSSPWPNFALQTTEDLGSEGGRNADAVEVRHIAATNVFGVTLASEEKILDNV